MKLSNIKAVFFDADDTIVDHKKCEKKALKYLFNNIQKEYKEQLLQTKENISSPEYIEEIAIEKLDMYLPNEKVYIDISK